MTKIFQTVLPCCYTMPTIRYLFMNFRIFVFSQLKGGGHIVFGADPVCVHVRIACFHALSSEPVDGF